MKRINYILLRKKPYQIDFPEEREGIDYKIPILAGLSDDIIDKLYSDWSEEPIALAGFVLSESSIKNLNIGLMRRLRK